MQYSHTVPVCISYEYRTVLFSYENDTVAYIIRVRVRVLYPDISRLCMVATVYSLVIRINSAIRGLNRYEYCTFNFTRTKNTVTYYCTITVQAVCLMGRIQTACRVLCRRSTGRAATVRQTDMSSKMYVSIM